MPTARDIVERAFREIRVLGRGSALSADDAAVGLNELQAAIGVLAAHNKTVPFTSRVDLALVAAQADYTFGSGGDFNTTAPIEIRRATVFDADNLEYPVSVYSLEQWANVSNKTTSGRPSVLRYTEQSKLAVWPVPTKAYTLRLYSHVSTLNAVDLNADLAVNDQWESLLIMETALGLASIYNKSISAAFDRKYKRARSAVSASAEEPPTMQVDGSLFSAGVSAWRHGSGYSIGGDV